VGVFLNPRLPKYLAQILTDNGSAVTGHKATRVEANAKSLRMCKVILLLFVAIYLDGRSL
jgi:hypothetical protein